jgi:hypothetical protein
MKRGLPGATTSTSSRMTKSLASSTMRGCDRVPGLSSPHLLPLHRNPNPQGQQDDGVGESAGERDLIGDLDGEREPDSEGRRSGECKTRRFCGGSCEGREKTCAEGLHSIIRRNGVRKDARAGDAASATRISFGGYVNLNFFPCISSSLPFASSTVFFPPPLPGDATGYTIHPSTTTNAFRSSLKTTRACSGATAG